MAVNSDGLPFSSQDLFCVERLLKLQDSLFQSDVNDATAATGGIQYLSIDLDLIRL